MSSPQVSDLLAVTPSFPSCRFTLLGIFHAASSPLRFKGRQDATAGRTGNRPLCHEHKHRSEGCGFWLTDSHLPEVLEVSCSFPDGSAGFLEVFQSLVFSS